MSKKLLVLFPGQGSQEDRLGWDLLASNDSLFSELLLAGSERVGVHLKELVADGSAANFQKASLLQPIITAHSLSLFNHLQKVVTPTALMGHSLGEVTALGAAGFYSFSEAVQAAAVRGLGMDISAEITPGGMRAVLMGSADEISTAITDSALPGLFLANDNAPNQVVISGRTESLDRFEEYATKHLRVKIAPIPVNGPWHTPCIMPAQELFTTWLATIKPQKPTLPILMNGTGEFATTVEEIASLTTKQLTLPVYFRKSVSRAMLEKYDAVLELGSGKILTGLLRANKAIKSFGMVRSASTLAELENFLEEFQK